jgi:hypothetical protein
MQKPVTNTATRNGNAIESLRELVGNIIGASRSERLFKNHSVQNHVTIVLRCILVRHPSSTRDLRFFFSLFLRSRCPIMDWKHRRQTPCSGHQSLADTGCAPDQNSPHGQYRIVSSTPPLWWSYSHQMRFFAPSL